MQRTCWPNMNISKTSLKPVSNEILIVGVARILIALQYFVLKNWKKYFVFAKIIGKVYFVH